MTNKEMESACIHFTTALFPLYSMQNSIHANTLLDMVATKPFNDINYHSTI